VWRASWCWLAGIVCTPEETCRVAPVLIPDIASHCARRCRGIESHFMRADAYKSAQGRNPHQQMRLVSRGEPHMYSCPRWNERLFQARPAIPRFLRLAGLRLRRFASEGEDRR
jgi:hypothetical protein